MNKIEIHQEQIKALCEKHKVKTLYAFGSVLNERFNSESDIDLLVKFQEIDLLDYADNYFNLLFSLQSVLDRKVDLVTEQSLKNPYFIEQINNTKQLIYAN
ncbi:nucleotidyltransferase [Bergeyella porcorum]|uniref:Nucleotidyltransferase n=1 Tax=Bergeyella porcorum TaxID=1735111 RepID=A0AAU0F1H5_9FLAO